VHTRFWTKNLKARDYVEDLGVDGNNIRIDLREIGWEDMGRIHLAQKRNQWWAL
jgi:uncharacterized protein YjcR